MNRRRKRRGRRFICRGCRRINDRFICRRCSRLRRNGNNNGGNGRNRRNGNNNGRNDNNIEDLDLDFEL